MVVDDLCVAVKFQSNSEIAGSPRNSFRGDLHKKIDGIYDMLMLRHERETEQKGTSKSVPR